MTREEAIQILRTQYPHDAVIKEALGLLIPELRESEDERIRKEIVGVIQKHYPNTPESYRWISWLEKQKVPEGLHPEEYPLTPDECVKPVEWSEKDKLTVDSAIFWLKRRLSSEKAEDISIDSCPLSMRKTIERLKYLRPQPHWKPSEKQIKALQMVRDSHYFMYQQDRMSIETLLEQLKAIQ